MIYNYVLKYMGYRNSEHNAVLRKHISMFFLKTSNSDNGNLNWGKFFFFKKYMHKSKILEITTIKAYL